jgi:glutamate-1-semialdehyde 2,1-aminomutase
MIRPALAAIRSREQRAFAAARPQSQALSRRAAAHFPHGVPMHWMRDWGTAFPMYVREAQGAVLVDVDGNRLIDFCLGDTGAMFGHSPPEVAQAIAAQSARGLTTMLPSESAAAVGDALAGIFGLPWWQLTQTATDANRAVLRLARAATGRQRILVFNHCYHGTVDETLVVRGADGRTLPRPGQIGGVHDFGATTRVVEFNDLPALESALAAGDVACVLTEPVMTNAGMVLPQPGFLAGLRAACTRTGTLLGIDETHTLSSGRGGFARQHGLPADFLVAGKAVAGGLPCAVYGYTEPVAEWLRAAEGRREPGHSGLGTTLSANPLALAALLACLTQVMTSENHAHMDRLAAQLASGIEARFARHRVGWQVSRVGARLEFGRAPAPDNGTQSLAAVDSELVATMQLYLLNRGFLLTPFHNMMLVSPATTPRHVAAFLVAFDQCLDEFAPLLGYA